MRKRETYDPQSALYYRNSRTLGSDEFFKVSDRQHSESGTVCVLENGSIYVH